MNAHCSSHLLHETVSIDALRASANASSSVNFPTCTPVDRGVQSSSLKAEHLLRYRYKCNTKSRGTNHNSSQSHRVQVSFSRLGQIYLSLYGQPIPRAPVFVTKWEPLLSQALLHRWLDHLKTRTVPFTAIGSREVAIKPVTPILNISLMRWRGTS